MGLLAMRNGCVALGGGGGVPAAAAAEDETVSYSLGDFADEIALIQERLNTLGYLEAAPDGSFGSQTETAVKGFQKNNELVETGIR